MSAAPAIPIEVRRIEEQAADVIATAKSIQITSQAGLELACEQLRRIKALQDAAIAAFGPIKEKAFAAHKEACAQEKRQLAPLQDAEKILKSGIAVYEMEQRRLREAEERRLLEEQERQHAEQLEAQIEEAERDGASVEEVQAIIEQPAPPRPFVPVIQQPRPAGITPRQTWHAEITSLQVLIDAVAKGQAPILAIEPNMTYLNGRARTDKALLKIPGVKAVPDSTVSVRR